jgi:general stress protein YciG
MFTEGTMTDDIISVKEAGRRGGEATLRRYGVSFYREIGKKGGKRTVELYKELLKEFGKKGGRPRRPSLDEMRQGHS